jgi:hypothetical protein
LSPFFVILPGSFETDMDRLVHDHSKAARNIREAARGEIPFTFANLARKRGSVARLMQDGIPLRAPLLIANQSGSA